MISKVVLVEEVVVVGIVESGRYSDLPVDFGINKKSKAFPISGTF